MSSPKTNPREIERNFHEVTQGLIDKTHGHKIRFHSSKTIFVTKTQRMNALRKIAAAKDGNSWKFLYFLDQVMRLFHAKKYRGNKLQVGNARALNN